MALKKEVIFFFNPGNTEYSSIFLRPRACLFDPVLFSWFVREFEYPRLAGAGPACHKHPCAGYQAVSHICL